MLANLQGYGCWVAEGGRKCSSGQSTVTLQSSIGIWKRYRQTEKMAFLFHYHYQRKVTVWQNTMFKSESCSTIHCWKSISIIILSRIKEAVDRLLRQEQAIFRKNRSCCQQIFALRQITEKIQACKGSISEFHRSQKIIRQHTQRYTPEV